MALPAAGFPGSRGGNCLAVKALHFLASSAVIAEARSGTEPSAVQASANSTHRDFHFADMTPFIAANRSIDRSFLINFPIIMAGFGPNRGRYPASTAGPGARYSSSRRVLAAADRYSATRAADFPCAKLFEPT